MNFSRIALSAMVPLCIGACSGGSDQETTGTTAQEIVRGEIENGRPQVVRLTVEMPYGFARKGCSGTYIAPRVVLTAAHCIPTTSMYTRMVVYHGNNFLEDYANLAEVPAPGTESPWAIADSWETHPSWNPSLFYPDLGIVYLDRELPFAPLPLGLWRLRDSEIGELGQIVGYGASKAFSADIQDNEGVGIKRSGYSPFLGSPPQNPKPDDPHPGLDTAEIRAALAMFDGVDPWPNSCAGDSGGPVIMRKGHHEFSFGVASWTANYCEGFSYYTRLDPFVPYLMDAMRRAGWASLKPTLSCVSETQDGRLRAHFGYKNDNGISLDVPYGPHNSLRQDAAGVRPTHFKPGAHPWAFGIEFGPDEHLSYRLHGRVGMGHGVVRAGADSPRCDPNDVGFAANQFCENLTPLACTSNDDCVKFWAVTNLEWVAPEPECMTAYVEWLKCNATQPLETFECFDGIVYPLDIACSTDTTLACFGM